MKVDSTLTVKDSVRFKSKLTVDQKAVFKQNVVVRGQLLRAYHNAKINNNLKVDNKLTVDGITKLNGILKLPNINSLDSVQAYLNNFNFIVLKPNGNAVTINPEVIGDIIMGGATTVPPTSDPNSPCLGYTSSINQAASWMYHPNNGYVITCKKVGIHKVPEYRLDVQGTARTQVLKSGVIQAGNQLTGTNPVPISGYVNILSNGGGDKIYIGQIINGAKKLCFKVKSNGTVVIKSLNGNNPLIIRNQNGQKIFQVQNNGLVRAREVKVDLDYANWPDYVFEKDYNILSLEQIAKYILKHKHLPGVPSATQIKTEGLSLGKMQTILMQKIEELTLYTIEQNTQIKDLENNVTQLEKENQQLKSELQQMNDRLDKIEAMLNHK